MLDDGRITDGQGRTVDFKNTVIILTQIWARPRSSTAYDDGSISQAARSEVGC
ncbi:MAG: AAA family ATPase [Christensenellaceae bacterium]